MEIQVKIIQILPELTGVAKSGNSWRKMQFVGETLDQYPKPIKFDVFNPATDFPIIRQGQTVTLSFDVDSRSYVGKDGVERWNTNVNVWRAVINAEPSAAPSADFGTPAQPN